LTKLIKQNVMKKFKSILRLTLLFVGTSLIMSSCSDDDPAPNPEPPGPKQKTIAEIVTENATASGTKEFTALLKALEVTNLAGTFANEAEQYTVFAPNDAAFIKTFGNLKPITQLITEKAATPEGKKELTDILTYHVLKGEVKSGAIAAGGNYVTTLSKGAASATQGISLYINNQGGDGIYFNGSKTSNPAVARVIRADIDASNGVIHIIDDLLKIPTVASLAAANANFSTLVSSLTSANLVSTLDGTANSPFTVFAPDNAAFTALDTTLKAVKNSDNSPKYPNGIGSLPAETVSNVLKYHVLTAKNVLSTDIPAIKDTDITTFLGETFKIVVTASGAKIVDKTGDQRAITATDIQGSNGVIHVVKDVLLPLTSL
jgi:uncharacterized surface protein with fasciclin (FAS1) repeats